MKKLLIAIIAASFSTLTFAQGAAPKAPAAPAAEKKAAPAADKGKGGKKRPPMHRPMPKKKGAPKK